MEGNKSGHINTTYVASFRVKNEVKKFVLQNINTKIFKEPEKLMENIENITKHLIGKINLYEKKDKKTIEIIKTTSGKNLYYNEDGSCWRVFKFIEGARTFDKVEKVEHMYKTGKAIGEFHKQLMDYPVDSLYEILPNFHNTELRYKNFLISLEKGDKERIEEAKEEIKFILDRGKESCIITNLLSKKEIPLRVTHNDTKFNNIMIDEKSEEPVAVIDLDTIMPGAIHYDFGDSIRTGATTALEDETDLNLVNFDIAMFEAYAKGFLEEMKGVLNDTEKKHLAFGAKLITYEQALRFLEDYINLDVYYKITRGKHNLHRARNQIKLVKDMEEQMDFMEEIINKYGR